MSFTDTFSMTPVPRDGASNVPRRIRKSFPYSAMVPPSPILRDGESQESRRVKSSLPAPSHLLADPLTSLSAPYRAPRMPGTESVPVTGEFTLAAVEGVDSNGVYLSHQNRRRDAYSLVVSDLSYSVEKRKFKNPLRAVRGTFNRVRFVLW